MMKIIKNFVERLGGLIFWWLGFKILLKKIWNHDPSQASMSRIKGRSCLQLMQRSTNASRQCFSTSTSMSFSRQNDRTKPNRNSNDWTIKQRQAKGTKDSKEMWSFLSELFISTGNTADTLTRYFRRNNIEKTIEKKDKLNESPPTANNKTLATSLSKSDPYIQLKKDVSEKFDGNISEISNDTPSSNVLYWPCGTITFFKSDFQRIMPKFSAQVTTSEASLKDLSDTGIPEFQVVRNRDPQTLTRWIGYYLVFPSPTAALKYYQETRGAELCGMQVNFSFVDSSFPIRPPVLYEVPNISRDMCALISGLPAQTSKISIAQILWDYNLLDDESKAIVKVMGSNEFSTWLLRFQDSNEPRRIRRKFHNQIWPYTLARPSIEILD